MNIHLPTIWCGLQGYEGFDSSQLAKILVKKVILLWETGMFWIMNKSSVKIVALMAPKNCEFNCFIIHSLWSVHFDPHLYSFRTTHWISYSGRWFNWHMHMDMCTRTCTRTYACTNNDMHIHRHRYIHIDTHTHTHIFIHAHAPIHMHLRTHTHTYLHMHLHVPHTPTDAPADTHKYMCIYIYKYIYTYIFTHT